MPKAAPDHGLRPALAHGLGEPSPAVGGERGPDLPELGRPAPEGPPAARHRGLRALREEPPEELPEPRRGVIAPHRHRCAAGRAPPPPGPR